MKQNVTENKVGRDEFRELAKDMKPVIKDMEAVLNKHDITCLASLTMSTDGYFNFGIHDSDWGFIRSDSNSRQVIRSTICEEI